MDLGNTGSCLSKEAIVRRLSMFAVNCILAGSALCSDVLAIEPTPPKPKEMEFTSLRGVQYSEIWFIVGTTHTGRVAYYFSTAGLNNRDDKKITCPPAIWDKLDPNVLKTEGDNHLDMVYMNGPRGYTVDSIKILTHDAATVHGLQARLWGKVVLPRGVDFTAAGPQAYQPLQSYRKSTLTFEKGHPVFILDDPKGTPWVMQGYSQKIDPKLTYDSLKTLGDKLKPPKDWKYRIVLLEKDLALITPEDYGWIVQDELQNTYVACKNGTSNYKP
jgi:hypothetical protein